MKQSRISVVAGTGLCAELERLRAVVATALFATKQHLGPLQTAHIWIQRAAEVLANSGEADRATVEASYRALLEEVVTAKEDPSVAEWVVHFYKVTRSYW